MPYIINFVSALLDINYCIKFTQHICKLILHCVHEEVRYFCSHCTIFTGKNIVLMMSCYLATLCLHIPKLLMCVTCQLFENNSDEPIHYKTLRDYWSKVIMKVIQVCV